MPELVYLVDEIGSGMEIYFSSRLVGRYDKTAFILCDDYVELLSKLWLVENVTDWKDTRENGSYKNFPQILGEVGKHKRDHCHTDEHRRIVELTNQMKKRRSRRNDFFHSPSLLDLNVRKRGCVEAFCDLTEFGELLFGDDWRREIKSNTKADILCTLFQLEKMAIANSTIEHSINEIFENLPRRRQDLRTIPKRGTQYANYQDDLYLRLCLDWNGDELRNTLKALLHGLG